jgi:hypothetical protein
VSGIVVEHPVTIGSGPTIDALLLRLEDESADERASAVRALGEIKNERAVDARVHRLRDESTNVRYNAAWALRQIGSERAIENLLPWLSITEWHLFPEKGQLICDWVYETVLEILAQHVPDPGVVAGPPTREPVVAGPWSRG